KVAFLLVAFLAMFWGSTAFGQTTTATLSGVVQDARGGAVPGVKITTISSQTGARRETTTDSEGRYGFTNLEPGPYDRRAEHAGFKAAMQSVVLTVGGAGVMDLTLQVGDVTEAINVGVGEPLIETTKAEISRVVDQRSIEALPNIGRNFVDFVKLS